MKKISLFVLIALAFALAASPVVALAGSNADPGVERVGYVIAYTPNESITIVDRDGSEFTFTLASELKVVPAHRADLLSVGSFVTIISPNNAGNGKGVATGIVIHPKVPNGFPIPTVTETPLPTVTSTAVPTETATESPTSTETPTATAIETTTATATSTGEVPTDTPTATGTVTATTANPQAAAQSFIQWLASIFNQFLNSNG
ncbi:MAG: hypothetical protein HYZ22_15600 [Chloroflexi bacterium]|nr:hypothetical protein [Chloroflexota bacterium]